ncbi:MAG TPA: hypothetical protein VM890_11465 [Longimicrobium sp.]|nr:hypothetical protein [Longimicrobium sp.]
MNLSFPRALVVFAALCAAPATAAHAQQRPVQMVPLLQPGARVRASVPQLNAHREVGNSGGWQVGTVVAVDTGSVTLRLERDGTEFRIPTSSLRALQVSRGTEDPGVGWKRDMRTGALAGMAAGAVVTALTVVTHKAYDDTNCDPDCELSKGLLRPTVGHGVLFIGGGGLLGGLFGGALGRTSYRERWEPLPVPPVRMQAASASAAEPAQR